MTDEVMLHISSSQPELEDADTELVTAARYFLKQGKIYLVYEEQAPGASGIINNMIRIAGEKVDVIRRGCDLDVHMVYIQGKDTTAIYHTGQGDLVMDISTDCIRTRISEELLETEIRYSFSLNGCYISKTIVRLQAAAMKSTS